VNKPTSAPTPAPAVPVTRRKMMSSGRFICEASSFHLWPNVSDHRTREPKANKGSVCRRVRLLFIFPCRDGRHFRKVSKML
jgi:hypothetical protein